MGRWFPLVGVAFVASACPANDDTGLADGDTTAATTTGPSTTTGEVTASDSTDDGATGDTGAALPPICAEAASQWGEPIGVEVIGEDEFAYDLDLECSVVDVQSGTHLVTTLECGQGNAAHTIDVSAALAADDPGPTWAVDDAVHLRYVSNLSCSLITDPGHHLEIRAADETLLVASLVTESSCLDESIFVPVPITANDTTCRPDAEGPATVPIVFALGDAEPLELVQGQSGIVQMADGSRYAAAVVVGEDPYMNEGDGVPMHGLTLRRLP